MGKPKIRRLLIAGGTHRPVGERPPGDAGWAVCIGDVPKPRYRCEWCVVGFYKTLKAAKRAHDKIEPKLGRLIARLEDPSVLLVPQTKPKEDPLKAFRRKILAAVSKSRAIKVQLSDTEQETVLGYPVGEHFAVHKSIDKGFGSLWTVTHLPSCLSAGSAHKNKTIAVAIAFAMQRLSLPWSSPDPQNTVDNEDEWKRAGALARMENLNEVQTVVECETLLT